MSNFNFDMEQFEKLKLIEFKNSIRIDFSQVLYAAVAEKRLDIINIIIENPNKYPILFCDFKKIISLMSHNIFFEIVTIFSKYYKNIVTLELYTASFFEVDRLFDKNSLNRMLDEFLQIISNNVSEIINLPTIVFITALQERKFDIIKYSIIHCRNIYNDKIIDKIILMMHNDENDFIDIMQIFINFSNNTDFIINIYISVLVVIVYYNNKILHRRLDEFLQIISHNVSTVIYLPDIVFKAILQEKKYNIIKIMITNNIKNGYSIGIDIGPIIVNKIISIMHIDENNFIEIMKIFVEYPILISSIMQIYKAVFLSINEFFDKDFLHRRLDELSQIISYLNNIFEYLPDMVFIIALQEKKYDMVKIIIKNNIKNGHCNNGYSVDSVNLIIKIMHKDENHFVEIIKIFNEFSSNIVAIINIYTAVFLSMDKYFDKRYLFRRLDEFLEIIEKNISAKLCELNTIVLTIAIEEKHYRLVKKILLYNKDKISITQFESVLLLDNFEIINILVESCILNNEYIDIILKELYMKFSSITKSPKDEITKCQCALLLRKSYAVSIHEVYISKYYNFFCRIHEDIDDIIYETQSLRYNESNLNYGGYKFIKFILKFNIKCPISLIKFISRQKHYNVLDLLIYYDDGSQTNIPELLNYENFDIAIYCIEKLFPYEYFKENEECPIYKNKKDIFFEKNKNKINNSLKQFFNYKFIKVLVKYKYQHFDIFDIENIKISRYKLLLENGYKDKLFLSSFILNQIINSNNYKLLHLLIKYGYNINIYNKDTIKKNIVSNILRPLKMIIKNSDFKRHEIFDFLFDYRYYYIYGLFKPCLCCNKNNMCYEYVKIKEYYMEIKKYYYSTLIKNFMIVFYHQIQNNILNIDSLILISNYFSPYYKLNRSLITLIIHDIDTRILIKHGCIE